jgi:hypothetical protein
MTAISSLPSLQAALRAASPMSRRADVPAVAGPAAQSSIVTLSTEGLAAQSEDAATGPRGVRFNDLAAPMFESLKAGAAVDVGDDAALKEADNRFTLNVVTAGGTKVQLTLASRGEELLVRVNADAALSGKEQEALDALAQGYQDAIDGLASNPPRVRLGGLAQLDSGVLRSIDLDAQVALPTVPPATQSLAFHLDAGQRSVSIDGPDGKLALNVKTDALDSVGTRQQQQKAIDSYLRQFDQAATRGQGDPQLMAMFKDAFSDLARTATRDEPATTPAPGKSWALGREDRAALTGLSDFTATVTQTPRYINPARMGEVDAFEYEVSQQTKVAGDTYGERSIAQAQQSHLSANYHEPLVPGAQLAFDFSSATQNYKYHTIDDTARSDVAIQYRDGRLQNATLRQSASRSDNVREYLLGKLKSERTVPAEYQLERDLVATLQPYEADGKTDTQGRELRRQQALDALGEETLLLGDAVDLAARDGRLRTPGQDVFVRD